MASFLVARSKAEGIQILDPKTLHVIKAVKTGKNFSLYPASGTVVVLHQSGDSFSVLSSPWDDLITQPVEKVILDVAFLDLSLLLVTVKLDANAFQYRVFDLNQKKFLDNLPLPVLPTVIYREGDYAYFPTQNLFLCRAGRTGLLGINLRDGTSKALFGGQDLGQFVKISNDHLAIFLKGKNGNPAKCQLFSMSGSESPNLIAERQFFKADRVEFVQPNSKESKNFLVVCHTDSDSTGSNYYGESQMYLYTAASRSFSLIQLDKKGPIHEVFWRPNPSSDGGQEFIVAYGFMPSRVALYTVKPPSAEILLTIPTEISVNLIRFHEPSGDFVLLGGFGNLPGKFEIWNCKTCRRVKGPLEAPGASKLSFCGSYLLAATVSPRLRVDNRIKIWTLTDNLNNMIELPFAELYNTALWIDPSENASIHLVADNPKTSSAVGTGSSSSGKYIPPSLRNNANATSLSASPSSVSQLKKALDSNLPHIDNRPKLGKEELRIKRLQERLDQIAILKDKQAQGLPLESNQLEKIRSESSVRQEISSLQKNILK